MDPRDRLDTGGALRRAVDRQAAVRDAVRKAADGLATDRAQERRPATAPETRR